MRFAELISGLLPLVPPLVRALLHSLWQGALVAGGCRLLLLLVPCRRPAVRYGLSLGSLAVVVLAFLVTWRLAMTPMQGRAGLSPVWSNVAIPVAAEPPVAAVSSPAAPDWQAGPASSKNWNWQTVFGCLWLAGVVLMVLRAARILYGETRLAGSAEPCRNLEILAMAEELRVRLRLVRRVAVAVVDRACSPAVVGMVAPVILVPASLVTGATPACLRAILAHELAHVRRWDILVNLLQLLVESLLFHNPFVWWLSAQVRQEREACCDAVAARCCGGGPAYARVLVEVGERVLADSPMVSLARPCGLADRVRRLLGLRPAGETWRLRPLSVAVALLAGFASFLVLAQGTFKATDAVLSATERIELIEQTVARQKEAAAVGTTRYSGRILTPEGNPLPVGTALVLLVAKPGSTLHQAIQVDRVTGRFDVQATGSSVIVCINADGYRPCFRGPLVPRTEPVVDFGDWILEPQIPQVVQVLGDRGQPVPEAKVYAYWNLEGNRSFGNRMKFTDANGECVLPLVADCPMSVEVTAADFEPAKFKDLYPEEGKPVVLSLRRSIPLVLRVTDRASGKPLPGAAVRELARNIPTGGSMTHQYNEAPVLGTSGPDGLCALSGLHREGAYWLLVEAEGHGPELVAGATPGEEATVALGPPRVVTGTITGNLGKLYPSGSRAEAWYWVQMGTTRHQNMYTVAPIRTENGIGTFRIETLYKGSFEINAGGKIKVVAVADGETTVEFVIPREGETAVPCREVRLEFEPKAGSPLPRGTMRVTHRDLDDRFYSAENLPVENGAVSLRVPVGSSVDYKPDGVIGGWFSRGRIDAVPAGDEPLKVGISYIPAGAIAVSLVDGDGRPTDGFMTSVREIEKSPRRIGPFLNVEGKTRSSARDGVYAFTATPLPLDGTYEIVIYRGCTYVTTGPIRVTEKEPFHERQLVLEGSATVSGQVVGPNGEPIADAPISLGLKLAGSSFGTSDSKTDEDGGFEFTGVVPHPQADYTVSIHPRRDFVPRRVVVAELDKPVRIVTEPGLVVVGRVLDEESGTPIRGAEVWLWRKTDLEQGYWQFKAEEPTDEEGNFRFSNLLPGEYDLQVRDQIVKSPRVVAGQTDPVVWRVPRKR